MGLAAIGKVYQEALIIAYGEGSNGKSTFWNAIAKVLGTYSGSMSADALTVGCKRKCKAGNGRTEGKAPGHRSGVGGRYAPEHLHRKAALFHR